MTKRILQIIPSLDRAGAEKQLVLLSTGLDRAEFDVHVCALTRGGPLAAGLDAAGVPLTVIGKRMKVDPSAWLRLLRLIRQLKPDLVQTWLFAANSYGRAAALYAGVKQIVASERSVDPWKRWHELAIDRYLAPRTARIVVNSSGIRDFYQQHGLPVEKFVVIPNGIDSTSVPTLPRADLLAELNLPPDARLIGAVGRLWPQKRVKDLIWVAYLLKVLRDDVHVLIIGDGPLRSRLERFARQVQIDSHVHFLGVRGDVPQLLPHFDCLWLASAYEGLPNVIMEAMLASVPVVATDISGNRDLVLDGHTGYLVPLGDRASFVRHTRTLLDDSAMAQRMGQAGRARIVSEFSTAKMIERFSSLYRELLG